MVASFPGGPGVWATVVEDRERGQDMQSVSNRPLCQVLVPSLFLPRLPGPSTALR